eukprot:424650-Alexandrium_andersonii.AAC.1
MMSPCDTQLPTALRHRQGPRPVVRMHCQLPQQHRELDTPAQRAPSRASACTPESAPQPDPEPFPK